jgi:hypothetical protein
MRNSEDYRGFRIEAEATDPTRVGIKIFALESDGTLPPEAEPMSSQAYEPAENAGDFVELLDAAFKVARSEIDDLVSPADGLERARPRHEIADDAKAGKTGRLTVPFVATDKSERLREMIRVLDSHPLEGLQATILLSHADIDGQPVPEPRPDLLGVQADSEVPVGEFHLLLALPAEAAG